MKVDIKNDNFIIYVNKYLINYDMKNRKDIEENIKDLLIRIRKIYKIKLSGYYKIKIYQNDLYGLIFECIKEDDLDFFPDFCDLKINILYDSKILLESDDFFIFNNNKKTYKKGNKFYINIKDLNELEIIKLSEFCKIKYC
ncbi:MAG TPA: hypothetical protein OIM65_03005 [Bacilli bacterium]|nr:hypothetical protein [Mycoplasmatota bacterium]MDY4236483.1 hypothetical protein [Bacilli bacterium]CDA23454.1 unknown [Mycoplasma sp. CAG:611]HJJ08269.1 hypothetical protein [Bacilli bacterium]